MPKKEVVIRKETILFNEEVENILKDGLAFTYKEIAEAIGFNEGEMSVARKLKGNVPKKHIETLEKVYNVQILTRIGNDRLEERLQRIEANLEVFQFSIAGLNAKKREDFPQKFSELQTLIEEAVRRRRAKIVS